MDLTQEKRILGRRSAARTAFLIAIILVIGFRAEQAKAQLSAQTLRPVSSSDPRMGTLFFTIVKGVLRDSYYDPKFRGIDIDKVFSKTDERLRSMSSMDQMFLIVSDALMSLNDPHTYLLPPTRNLEPEYGFATMMVGDKCYVTNVKPNSQAYSNGLRSGDQIASFGTIVPNRRNFWQVKLFLYALGPVNTLKLDVEGVDGKKRQLEIQPIFVSSKAREEAVQKLDEEEIAQPFTCKDLSTDLIACKVRTFNVKKGAFNDLYKDIAGKKKLILDLRGNRGGIQETALDFAGHFFDNDVVAFNSRSKNKSKEHVAMGRKDAFSGEVAVILDSLTSGVSELLARIMQLEKRARVYGDISAGCVTESEVLIVQVPRYIGQTPGPGMDILTLMGVSVREPIMRDGSSLEGTGVVPDEPIGPSGYSIRESLDPILSHVAERMGVQISAKQAGSLGFMFLRRIEMIEVPSKATKNTIYAVPVV